MEDQREIVLRFRLVIVPTLFILVVLAVFFGSITPVSAPPPPPPNETPSSIFLSADPTGIPADGLSTSMINASVWEEGEFWVWFGLTVNFSTDSGEITASALIVNGTATAILTAGTEPGVATITAEANFGDFVLTNTTTVNFTTTEFDTGAGAYPSIAGMHIGILIPNHTVIVKKLLTYPCAGTGGHVESVAFYNTTTGAEVANASWNGYQGDYHNLTFPEQFTLAEGEDYRYEIVTGSYPLIIHKQNHTTSDGFINCTSFVDVNGDAYDDWIPAFRLGR